MFRLLPYSLVSSCPAKAGHPVICDRVDRSEAGDYWIARSSRARTSGGVVARVGGFACLFLSTFAFPAIAQESLTVFAAASLKNALDDVDAAFAKATGIKVTASYAASSALAKQIEQGAPADVFASADIDWMD